VKVESIACHSWHLLQKEARPTLTSIAQANPNFSDYIKKGFPFWDCPLNFLFCIPYDTEIHLKVLDRLQCSLLYRGDFGGDSVLN
jgi:hypothetical protein